MKRLFALIMLVAASGVLHAQVADTTVCDVLKDPVSFNGKIVRIKGTVTAGFDEFIVRDQNCGGQVNAIWVSYPEGTKAKAGPAALLELQPAKNFSGTVQAVSRTPVQMDKSKDFKQFDSLLSTPHKIAGMCLGCNRYTVSATLVGRLDGVAHAGVKRDKAGKIVAIDGFGNLNAYPARLVLQSVSDVSPHEADYSKSDPIAKDDRPIDPFVDPEGQDMVGALRSHGVAISLDMVRPLGSLNKAALAFPAGSPAQVAIQRATEAYGAKSFHSGVTTSFGSSNEANPKNEAQGNSDSQDGVLYNCTFNTSRLDSDAMPRAVVHIGEHIADVRSPSPDGPLVSAYDLENQAWSATVLAVVGFRQRTLTLPGGYLLWNSAWSQTDQVKLPQTAIRGYLTNEEFLSQ